MNPHEKIIMKSRTEQPNHCNESLQPRPQKQRKRKTTKPVLKPLFPYPFFSLQQPSPEIKMGHRTAGTKMSSFCLNRIRPPRGGVRPPSLRFQRKEFDSEKTEELKTKEGSERGGGGDVAVLEGSGCIGGGDGKPEVVVVAVSRKIMVVVDSSAEAKGALQWALTHTVQSHDTLILLHTIRVCKQGDKGRINKKMVPRAYELLHNMKKMCNTKRPEVQVEITMVEGKEKGPTILEAAKKQEVSMLVLGQKKKAATTWRLLMMWAGNKVAASTTTGGGVVEYCIQNADCMAVAVRRKSEKLGGYLITTKRHKDFWLLA